MRDDILYDLREFRRGQDLPSVERLASLNFLVEYLGEGSENTAFQHLDELRRTHGYDIESDIGAFFYTSGFVIGLTTLERRLYRYAEEYSVNESTALRRSDRGAIKLATIIRDATEISRPWITAILVELGGSATLGVTISMVEDQSFRRPIIRINDEPVPPLEFALIETNQTQGLLEATETIGQIPLSDLGNDVLLRVEIDWALPVAPSWTLSTNCNTGGLLARHRLGPAWRMSAEVLHWDMVRPPAPPVGRMP